MDEPTPIADAASKPPQRFRRTRIAVSVFFGVLAVALCVLWVRSYKYHDYLQCKLADVHILSVSSNNSVVHLSITRLPFEIDSTAIPPWATGSNLLSEMPFPIGNIRWHFSFRARDELMVTFPHWIAIAIAGTLSVVAGLPSTFSFSLRTMLIATTLVAVVLGFGVWMAS